jgi:threonine/homoserine/homoserine lactone efflux protein
MPKISKKLKSSQANSTGISLAFRPMEAHTLLVFTATVLPLICTPGPDMLFVASQAVSGGYAAGFRAIAGVCLGYVVHSTLVALGVAAILAASPLLFNALRWVGIAYLLYLAYRLIRSALRKGTITLSAQATNESIKRGFLTAVLNPGGLMIYFAILPQFIQPGSRIALQALILSAMFVFWCGVVYSILILVISAFGKQGTFGDHRREVLEGCAGTLLIIAAGFMASR